MNRPCEVCGGINFAPYPNKRQVPLSRCLDCGLIRCTTVPTPEDVAKIYNQDYYRSWGLAEFHDSVERMKRSTFGRILSRAEKYAPSKGALLDVGCAVGFLLQEAQARGWQPYGVELAKAAVAEAQAIFGDHVARALLEDKPFPGLSFDAITMIDLIEHVRFPEEVLTQCYARLKPNGLIVIGTPNTQSFTAKWSKGHWEQIKEEHLFYFSPENISRLLDKKGFDVLELLTLRKSLNLEYVTSQLTVYPMPIVTPIVRAVHALTLPAWRSKNFWTSAGEMLVIARKRS